VPERLIVAKGTRPCRLDALAWRLGFELTAQLAVESSASSSSAASRLVFPQRGAFRLTDAYILIGVEEVREDATQIER
jgi:hypothetical protein